MDPFVLVVAIGILAFIVAFVFPAIASIYKSRIPEDDLKDMGVEVK